MQYISVAMLDRFEVYRDAEKMAQAWGPIDYLYPHLRGAGFKPKSRVGVLVGSPAGLRYGHMTFGYKDSPADRYGSPILYEDGLLAGSPHAQVFRTRRCLIPADRWYYHRHNPKGRFWYAFHPVAKSTLAFAGLYSSFAGPEGVRTNHVALIGLSSVEFYQEYENRMPGVFLPGPEAIEFLNPKLPEHKAWELVRAFPAEQMMVEPCEEWAAAGD